MDTFAREIREITENSFFKDVYTCSHNDRKNGTIERVVGDTVLLCNYPDQYKKDTKVGFKWLNENGTIHDFNSVNDLLTRLTASVGDMVEARLLFNSKHTHIFVAAFKAFSEMGRNDKEFGEFLHWFLKGGNDTEIDGKAWNALGIGRSTRDSGVVHAKIDYLVALVEQYTKEIRKAA